MRHTLILSDLHLWQTTAHDDLWMRYRHRRFIDGVHIEHGNQYDVYCSVDLLSGKTSNISFLTSLAGIAKLVPGCAMHVSRSSDGGQLSLSPAAIPCDCYYEATATGAVPATCQTCSTDAECPSKHCRYGYCEPR